MILFRTLGVLLLTVIFSSAAWTDEHATQASAVSGGYLGEEIYQKLEDVESSSGRMVKRWIGPKLSFANYKTLLVEDVIFHPEPKEDAQIKKENLEAIRAYFTLKLRERLGDIFTLAEEPGAGVMRIRVAITGVDIKTQGMKGYEVLPVAAVFGGVKALTGSRKREVRIFIEAKVSDSLTDETIGAAVERTAAESLKNKREELELDHMQGNLKELADEARLVLEGLLEAPATE